MRYGSERAIDGGPLLRATAGRGRAERSEAGAPGNARAPTEKLSPSERSCERVAVGHDGLWLSVFRRLCAYLPTLSPEVDHNLLQLPETKGPEIREV